MLNSVGIVRKVDSLGRIVLPKELRDSFSIDLGEPLEIFVDGPCIILKKYERACIFCGEASDVRMFKGKVVCGKCENELKNTVFLSTSHI